MFFTEILKYNSFIIDLDNTLFDEDEYLMIAYEKISEHIAKSTNYSAPEVKKFLINEFTHKGRQYLFDKLIYHFKLEEFCIKDALNILRNFDIDYKLELSCFGTSLLDALISNQKKVTILTNGNVEQQKNKIRLINWKGLDNKINFIFSNEFMPKPSTVSVSHILSTFFYEKEETLFIGDSEVDKQCADAAEIDFVVVNDLIFDS